MMYVLDSYKMGSDNYKDIKFKVVGFEQCQPLNRVGPKIEPYYTIHFIIDGKGTYEFGHEQFVLHKKECFMLFPNEVCYYEPDSRTPWTYYWVSFDGPLAESLFSLDKPVFTFDSQALEIIKGMYELSQGETMGFYKDLMLQSKLIELIAVMTAAYQKGKEDVLSSALNMIHYHYQDKITIEGLAKSLHIDRTYLFQLFKRRFGMSPKQYIIAYRMNRAYDLIQHTEITFKEIAAAVGYLDYALFYRNFMKYKGISPKLLRNNGNMN